MKDKNTPPKKSDRTLFTPLLKALKKVESVIGNMKFAVVIILLFAISLVYGTFMESYHGREFANKLVYKSWWFMGMQAVMFLSILTATLARLPVKKKLYGFYTLHSGLLILFIGSFLTYSIGVDGMMELLPNQPTNKVSVQEDRFMVYYPEGNVKSFALPTSAFPSDMSYEEENLKIKRYLPFSKLEKQWRPSSKSEEMTSATYTMFNEMVTQELTLSLHPQSDFQSMQKMGPLSVHYMPKSLYSCFIKDSKSGFLLWDTLNDKCVSAEEGGFDVGETPTKNRFMVVPKDGKFLKFFPDFSPMPLNDDLTKQVNSPYRAFSKSLFEQKPNLFLFGNKLVFYSKRKGWQGKEFASKKQIRLPWMNFKIVLDRYETNKYPVEIPVYTRPVQDSGEIVEGGLKSILVEYYGKDYWIRSDGPLALEGGGKTIRFKIGTKELLLPYQITLSRFKMDKNPGTNDPASYESFVELLDGRNTNGSREHHVFMNNPLKYDEFTFYQSSYFQVGPEQYGSAFSVNYDPGRPLKYFGSFLLVFGSAWHFFIRRRKKRKFFEKETTIESSANNAPLGESNA